MKKCAICGKPLDSGMVVHPECVPRWIPVTERLPEKHEKYIVFVQHYSGSNSMKTFSYKGEYFSIGVTTYTPHKGWGIELYHEAIVGRMNKEYPKSHYERIEKVIYWMPLPKPPEMEE